MAGSSKGVHCISCGAEIPSDAIEKKEAPEAKLARLLEIQDFPLTHAFYFCSGKCRNSFNGEKKTRQFQAEALGKISHSPVVTKILATKIRVGNEVDVHPDLSAHRKVYGGLGKVVQLRFNPDVGSAELKVRCISGDYWISPTGCHEITENRTLTRKKGDYVQRGQPPSRDIKAIKNEAIRKARCGFVKQSYDLRERFKDEVLEVHMADSISQKAALVSQIAKKSAEVVDMETKLNQELEMAQSAILKQKEETAKQKEETAEVRSKDNRLRRQNALLRKENGELAGKVADLKSKIVRLESKVAELSAGSIDSMWLPGVIDNAKGQPFDNKTRLLVMEFLSFGVPVGSVCRAIAAVLENVFFQPAHKEFLQRKLALPSRRFVQDMVIELGSLNKCVLGVLIAKSDRVNSWGSDGSPFYGDEVLATAIQLESTGTSNGARTYDDVVLGFSTLPDQKSATEARIIKNNVFDRIAGSVTNMNMAIEEESLDAQLRLQLLDDRADPILDFEGREGPKRVSDIKFEDHIKGVSDIKFEDYIVDTDRIGVSRLGNSVAQSDNAAAALKVKDEMAPLIAQDAEEKYDKANGRGAWKVRSTLLAHLPLQFVLECPHWLAYFLQALPQEKRESLTRVFKANCMRHLTNTFLGGGVKEEKATLKALYEEDEHTRPLYLRDPSDLNAFMVTLSKGVSTGKDTYGKGFGEDFKSFNKNRNYKGLVCPMDRWDHGQRMDFSTRGGKITYWMRACLVFWLRMCIFSEPNILRDSMFITLTDTKNITSIFVRAIVDCKFTARWTPLLCNTGKSCADAAPVIQAVHRACKIPEERYPVTFFAQNFDVFEEFNTPGSSYAQWLEHYKNQKGRTCDGKLVYINQAIDGEIFDPQELSNRSDEVREHRNILLSAWLKGMLHTIENGEAARYLEGGDMSNLAGDIKDAFDGSWATTNILEGAIGDLKHFGRRTDNSSVVTAGNLAVAQRNNMFGSPDAKYLRKRGRDADLNPKTQKRQRMESGRFTSLSSVQTNAILTSCRKEKQTEILHARTDKKIAQAAAALKQTEGEKKAQGKYISECIKAEMAIEASMDIPDSDVQSKSLEVLQAQLESSLVGKSTGQQFTILKKILDRYVCGMQYGDLKPASYTSKKRDADENNTYLKAAVINAWTKLKAEKRTFHAEAVMPRIKVRNLGSIGPVSEQRKSMLAEIDNVNEADVRKAASERRAQIEIERKLKADAKKKNKAREKNAPDANGVMKSNAVEEIAPELKDKGSWCVWT